MLTRSFIHWPLVFATEDVLTPRVTPMGLQSRPHAIGVPPKNEVDFLRSVTKSAVLTGFSSVDFLHLVSNVTGSGIRTGETRVLYGVPHPLIRVCS